MDPADRRRHRGRSVRADRARRRLGPARDRTDRDTRRSDGYRLTGEKLWISNAPEADIYTVFARSDRGRSPRSPSPATADGLSGEHKQLLSPHPIGSLRFDQVYVPRTTTCSARPATASRSRCGRSTCSARASARSRSGWRARRSSSRSTTRSTRHTFKKPLKDHQAVSHALADLDRQDHTPPGSSSTRPRAPTTRASTIPALAAMAKLLATETAQEAVDAAVQFHGADGARARPPARAPLPRRPRAPDLRGRLRDPARDHRAAAVHGRVSHGLRRVPPCLRRGAPRDSGLTHAAQTAERLGFSTVWAADRIIIPWKIETDYAYSWSNSFIVPPEKPFLESMTALAFLAGATETIKLGVSVLVTTYRDPSSGPRPRRRSTGSRRADSSSASGSGGWRRSSPRSAGPTLSPACRGRRGAARRSPRTCSPRSTAASTATTTATKTSRSTPRATIPIWCGGESRGAQRRAGIYGDAWFPYFARVTPEELHGAVRERQAPRRRTRRDSSTAASRSRSPTSRSSRSPTACEARPSRSRTRSSASRRSASSTSRCSSSSGATPSGWRRWSG